MGNFVALCFWAAVLVYGWYRGTDRFATAVAKCQAERQPNVGCCWLEVGSRGWLKTSSCKRSKEVYLRQRFEDAVKQIEHKFSSQHQYLSVEPVQSRNIIGRPSSLHSNKVLDMVANYEGTPEDEVESIPRALGAFIKKRDSLASSSERRLRQKERLDSILDLVVLHELLADGASNITEWDKKLWTQGHALVDEIIYQAFVFISDAKYIASSQLPPLHTIKLVEGYARRLQSYTHPVELLESRQKHLRQFIVEYDSFLSTLDDFLKFYWKKTQIWDPYWQRQKEHLSVARVGIGKTLQVRIPPETAYTDLIDHLRTARNVVSKWQNSTPMAAMDSHWMSNGSEHMKEVYDAVESLFKVCEKTY